MCDPTSRSTSFQTLSLYIYFVYLNTVNMTSNKKTVIAFDLYGTLLSTESIARELATHFGDEKAKSIAALWRRWAVVSLI